MKSIKDVRERLPLIIEENHYPTANATVILHILQRHPAVKGKKKTIPYGLVVEQLTEDTGIQVSINQSVQKVRSVYNTYKSLINHVDRNWEKICSFLSTEFIFPSADAGAVPSCAPNPDNCQESSPPPNVTGRINNSVTTPVKIRRDCQNCPSAKKTILSLSKSLKREKQEAFRVKLAAANVKRIYKVRENKQKVKRQGQQLDALKKKFSCSQRETDSLRRANRRLADSIDDFKKRNNLLEGKNSKLSKQNTHLCEQIKNLQNKVKALEKELRECNKSLNYFLCEEEYTDTDDSIFASKEGKTYNVDIRMCIYYELMYDVPVNHCGPLIAAFLKVIDGKHMQNVPAASTCAQMAFELGILSTIRLMEFMLSQKHLCLSWDATTVDGSHVNEVHLTANKVDCLVLDVRHLAGGRTGDYVTHIMSTITESAAIFARFKQKSEGEVLAELKAAISATLTDRAAVNACVTRQLCNEMDSQLVQLNCNIHPLDSVARSTKGSLKEVDKRYNIRGNCYGSEGSAANLINAISVLRAEKDRGRWCNIVKTSTLSATVTSDDADRFKDGTGDPLGFKNFLKQHDLPVGTFVRYVGNRIHVLFHLAGLIVLHRDKLLQFIESQCCAAALIRTCVIRDLKNDRIMTQIWALALLGKLLTGPWMTRFYSSTMSNLEMAPFIQLCISNLKRWLEDPRPLQQPTFDAFDKELDHSDNVTSAIFEFFVNEEEVMIDSLKGVLSGALTILERQLDPFITGHFSQPSPEIVEASVSAPTHNMASERTLGCLDKMWRRAPNASLGFLNGKVRFKMNKVMKWLEEKSAGEKKQLIEFVISEGRDERGREALRHEKLVGEVAERRREVSDKRLKSKKASFMRQIRQALSSKSVSGLGETFSESIKRRLETFISEPESALGTLVIHSCDNIEWYGRIQSIHPCASKFDVGYWTLEEAESNSSDYVISVASFYAEAVLGTIVFV